MVDHVLVWDFETVPDLLCVARVNSLDQGDEAAARAALGDKFPKLPFHKVVCIGALVAERVEGSWQVRSLGAPHVEDRCEAELLQSFVDMVDNFRPQMITFNGSSFDLPVLRYRSMINRVSAPGLEGRRYWYRYSDDCLDLCDALACYNAGAKMSLNDLCRALGLPGKPAEMDGSQVERYVLEGRIADVAGYCETDVISTYRIWLIYELFRGNLTCTEFQASEAHLLAYLGCRKQLFQWLSHRQHLTHRLLTLLHEHVIEVLTRWRLRYQDLHAQLFQGDSCLARLICSLTIGGIAITPNNYVRTSRNWRMTKVCYPESDPCLLSGGLPD